VHCLITRVRCALLYHTYILLPNPASGVDWPSGRSWWKSPQQANHLANNTKAQRLSQGLVYTSKWIDSCFDSLTAYLSWHCWNLLEKKVLSPSPCCLLHLWLRSEPKFWLQRNSDISNEQEIKDQNHVWKSKWFAMFLRFIINWQGRNMLPFPLLMLILSCNYQLLFTF